MAEYKIHKGVKLPERPVLSHVGRLFNYLEAKEAKLRSASAWRRECREIIGGVEPAGFVVAQVRESRTLDGNEAAILETLADGSYRVVRNGWYVYSVDQTQPRTKRRIGIREANRVPATHGEDELPFPAATVPCDQAHVPASAIDASKDLPPSPLPSPSLSPLVSTISADSHLNPSSIDELQLINSPEENWELITDNRRRQSTPSAYVPQNWTEDLGTLQEESYCLLHLMKIYQFVNGLAEDDFVDMAFEQCARLIPNYPRLLKLLMERGLVERTTVLEHPLGFEIPRGIEGIVLYGTHKAYGYRLRDPAYRHATWTKRPITKKSILRRLDDYENAKYPVQRWLQENNTRLEVFNPPESYLDQLARAECEAEGSGSVEDRRRAYEGTLRLIRDGTWLCTFDPFSRRFHNNATALKRELRQFLRVGGEPLVEIDIKAAQPLFLGLLARQKSIPEADRFLRVCESDLYQYLAEKGGWTREHVKEHLMQRALFSPNKSRWQRTAVKRLFDREFPEMARFFREAKYGRKTKENPKPHNKLARMAQKAEVNFVIFTVCERIRKERPNCWLTTIHDSVLCRPEDGEYVKGVMVEESAKLGVCPRLEVRSL